MVEHDALVLEYSHLRDLPRQEDALHSLKKISSLVKPIMRARGWKVGTLAEFYPVEHNLLGINMNKGQKICLRLRYPGDKTQFLPLEEVVDTMLHELSHNVIGPHNQQFHALWDQLRGEYESLVSKGYTGEGFLSNGHRLGGRRIPPAEARRLAQAAAEKRRNLSAGSGQKLGGRPVPVGTDIRQVIVGAIERRNMIVKGCGSENKSDKEIIDLTNEATNNGFSTKAEEDQANDRAIAEAMWDLVQEDEKDAASARGEKYIPPSAENPTGLRSSQHFSTRHEPSTLAPLPNVGKAARKETSSLGLSPSHRQPARPISRLVSQSSSKGSNLTQKQAKKESETYISITSTPGDAPEEAPRTSNPSSGWTCPICTLHNPINYLACDACAIERPAEITQQVAVVERTKTTTVPKQNRAWACHRCSTIMDNQWWTCSTCGTMKQSS